MLGSDLGPFQEDSDEWGSYSIVLPKFNAKIIAASSEQSIRGIRHGAYRPDLIICDDVEDLSSVKTREGREKTFNWFTGEIVPCGSKSTKMIVIGNLLHEDSLLMRLKGLIDDGKINAIYKFYPLVDADGHILWQGMFANMEEVEMYKKTIGDEKSWQREYMLKIIADADQIIKPEWIQFYDELPDKKEDYLYTATGVDLAISKSETADYTAAVTAKVYGQKETLKIYILPYILNERIDFPTTLTKIKDIANNILDHDDWRDKLYIEDVAYQKALIQTLKKDGFRVEGVPTNGQDKRARLNLVSHLISSGKVLFPRNTSKELINQLVYFGVEKHDDLSDALTILLTMILKEDKPKPMVITAEIAALLRGGGGSSYGRNWSYWAGEDPPMHSGVKTWF